MSQLAWIGVWTRIRFGHTPVHGSWLNQVEIYHSIIQRKLLNPNDFDDTAAVARASRLVEALPMTHPLSKQVLVTALSSSRIYIREFFV